MYYCYIAPRVSNSLLVQPTRMKPGKRAYGIICWRKWNNLPIEPRQITVTAAFRSQLMTFVSNNVYL
jgi:hypothetical protein